MPNSNDPRFLLQTERLALLNEISRVLSSSLDLTTLYTTIYEQIGRVMDASQFYVALHAPDGIHIPFLVEEGHYLFDEHLDYSNTITSYAVEHGVTILYGRTEECQEWERSHGLEELIIGDEDSESGIFVPLTIGRRSIGTLSVQSQCPHAYSDEDVRTLAVIASQAAVAIENARLYSESRSSVQRMQILLEVARTVRSSLSLPVVLDSILTSVHAVIPYYMAEIFLPDVAHGHFEMMGSAGHRAEERRDSTKIPLGEGLTGRVYATSEALIVADVRLMPEYIATGVESALSVMIVPLQQGDTTIGVLNLQREEVNAFTEEDLRVLSLFSSQAAIAIENARLFTEQQQRVSELQTIQSIVQQLTPLHEIPAIAQLFEHELGRLIEFDACRLFVVDHQAGVVISLTPAGQPVPDTRRPLTTDQPDTGSPDDVFRLRIGEGITGWIAQRGEAVLIDNTLEDDRCVYIPGTSTLPESVIGAPLIYEGKVRGVITLTKYGIARFDQNELHLLRIIAAQGALAFDRARLYAELRTDAITDPLTGLYNRRALRERLSEEHSRAVRNHHSLVAIMVDIDQFKRVNDRWGHDAGDVVLAELARLIKVVVRAEDVVARFGGEEFCVILPEIPLDFAIRVAERLRATIAGHEMPVDAGVGSITASVGLASLDEGELEAELLSRADRAMYHAKKTGGNSTAIHESGSLRSVPREA